MPTAPESLATAGAGLFASLAMLLALAGLAKLVRPGATAITIGRLPGLGRLGLLPVARVVGGLELVVAAAALAVGSRLTAMLVTACYLAFVVVTIVLLRVDADADCGCFGVSRSPLNRVHLAATASFATVAAVAVVAPPGPFLGLARIRGARRPAVRGAGVDPHRLWVPAGHRTAGARRRPRPGPAADPGA